MRYSIILVVSILILFPALAFSATLKVPGQYPTIQDAINAAVNGDTVLVAPGTYVECVTMKDGVDLIGSGATVTIIDGSGTGSTVSTSGVTALIKGFSIINGNTYGLMLWSSSHVTAEENIIRNNQRGIGLSGGSNTVRNCLVLDNASWGVADGSGNHVFTNNTINGNYTGYYVGNGPFPTLTNNIITNNQIGIDETNSGVATLSYNDVWNNGKDYSGCVPGPGDISADPLYVDLSNNDFHITFDSPCKDMGTNTAPDLPLIDFEGDPRIADGTVDMGADEFYPHLYYSGMVTPGASFDLKAIGEPTMLPVFLLIGSGIYDPPVYVNPWGLWYLQLPFVMLDLGLIPNNGVLILTSYIDPSTPTPLDIPLQALIFPTLTNLCVLEIR